MKIFLTYTHDVRNSQLVCKVRELGDSELGKNNIY